MTLLGGDVAVSAEDAAARIVMVSHRPVVVTQGAEGVLLVTGDSVVHVPAPVVSVRDTTGAGDTFNGVLAARLAAGDDLGAAVPYAVAAAALSVTAVGARGGMPTADAIEAATDALNQATPCSSGRIARRSERARWPNQTAASTRPAPMIWATFRVWWAISQPAAVATTGLSNAKIDARLTGSRSMPRNQSE